MRSLKIRRAVLSLLSVFALVIIYRALHVQTPPSIVPAIEESHPNGTRHHLSHFQLNRTLTSIRVIPIPQSVDWKRHRFPFPDDFRLATGQKPSNTLQSILTRYSKYISALTGRTISVDQTSSSSPHTLFIDCAATADQYPDLGEDESYTLNVTDSGACLSARTLSGVSRGLATFVQLIERDFTSQASTLPTVSIVDKPRFAWRGLMLDLSRHWMPAAVIERTLNAMELCKLNVLHLHLSDDQGFRVESLVHPLLHDRKEFLSQKEVRHLVAFAEERRIRLVPEFDIPGHTTSWFVGYPDLATVPGAYQLATQWGVLPSTMDPTKESTYTFLDRFFEEMSGLFPDPYFHIGGDEVEGSQWAQSSSVQEFIKQQNLTHRHDLQAYFNKRIQNLLKKYKKVLVGWEEILDNLAVDQNAVIQSWKNRRSVLSAVRKGYRALLSHGYYLDFLESSMKHYDVDPILDKEKHMFGEKDHDRFLGGEACLWSEYVSQDSADSRLWPRSIAVAERFWSNPSAADRQSLYDRLFRLNNLLDAMSTGVTHLSLYKTRLRNLLVNDKQQELLHPLVILADVCEPGGLGERSATHSYTSTTPLTTFADALQAESEQVWRIQQIPIDDKALADVFETWSLSYVRLKALFDHPAAIVQKKVWRQDLEQLAKNLAHVGRIGLNVLGYHKNRVFHPDKNDPTNNWTLPRWITHHRAVLSQMQMQVSEVHLVAVRPVLRLLEGIEKSS